MGEGEGGKEAREAGDAETEDGVRCEWERGKGRFTIQGTYCTYIQYIHTLLLLQCGDIIDIHCHETMNAA
jgi:hypothetical protein